MSGSWKIQTLGEVCKFQRGLTYTKADEVESSSNAVLRANNINLFTNKLKLEEIRYIDDSVLVPASKKVVKNSIIICTASGSKSHLGKVALIEEDYDYAFGGFMGQIRPEPHILAKFLFYVMTGKDYKNFITSLSNGMSINNLKFDELRLFSFSVPPLTEQKRIVAILDEAFEGIDTAVANTEKNFANARELFESYLNSVFSQKDRGWAEKRLGDICGFEGGSQPPKSEFVHTETAEYVRFIQIRDFASDKNLTYIPVSRKNRLCKDTDILIGRYGASVGRILTGKSGAYNVAIIKTIPDLRIISHSWFYNFLISERFQNELLNVADRSAQAGFSKDDIYNFLVPVPSLTEQAHLTSKIDAISAEAARLKSVYEQKLTSLGELKQTVLQKAFAGELTAQSVDAVQEAAE